MSKMSCFTDCNANDCVLRIPIELAVSMYEHLPRSDEKDELRSVMLRAKSKKLNKMMRQLED